MSPIGTFRAYRPAIATTVVLLKADLGSCALSLRGALSLFSLKRSIQIPAPARQPTAREAAAQKRIAELRMRLLDLTNRNRLLNFKFAERSRRVVRIVDGVPDALLETALDGRRPTFRSLPEPGNELPDEKTEEFLLALEQAKRSDEEYLAAMKRLEDEDADGDAARKIERALRDRLRVQLGMPPHVPHDEMSRSEWARRNGINPSFDLPASDVKREREESRTDARIQTLLLPDEMERALSGIYDQARSSLQETGVNTLYLALGFLEWYEAPAASRPMFAPLLLHAVDVDRRIVGGKYRYALGSVDEDTQTNITLSERLHKDFHRRLPELAEDDLPEAYFRKVEETIADLRPPQLCPRRRRKRVACRRSDAPRRGGRCGAFQQRRPGGEAAPPSDDADAGTREPPRQGCGFGCGRRMRDARSQPEGQRSPPASLRTSLPRSGHAVRAPHRR